jgi:hypothetical protein
MDTIKGFFEGLFGAAAGLVMMAFFLSFSVGTLYWLWMAIQLGSFLMFAVILFPPAFIVTGPVGAYALIFGPPQWVINMFG